jgi:tetratricopeptide (TPR) repeat protein
MSEHVAKEPSLPARGPSCGRCGASRTGAIARLGVSLAVVAGLGLAGTARAHAQAGGPPEPDKSPALPGDAPPAEPAAGSKPGEPAVIADDSAAVVTEEEEAPWNEGVELAQRRAARAVFLEANGLSRKRFFATAAAKYKQAIELWPHPAFVYNLALAQVQLDQLIEAHANLKAALEHGPGPLGDRYDQAQQQLALIETELATLEVSCAEPGARVMLDGKLLFTGPGEYLGVVRPGAHQLVATRRGLAPVVEQVVISPGEKGGAALAFEYPEVEVVTRTRRWPAWRAYTVVGAGAALVLAGVALDRHSSGMFEEYDRDYDSAFRQACPTGCTEAKKPPVIAGLDELEDRRARAEDAQRWAVVSYAVGGAALATGAVLAYIGRERTVRSRVRVAPEAEASDGTTTSAIVPMVSPGIVGVSAGFRF